MIDEKIARKLYKKLKRVYKPQNGFIVIADKAYDVRDFYTFVVDQIKAEPIIPINPRNTQPDLNYSPNGHRICQAGLEMIPNGVFKDANRLRLKERCPLKASKQIAAKYLNGCPCHNPKFNVMVAPPIRTSPTMRVLKYNAARHPLLISMPNALSLNKPSAVSKNCLSKKLDIIR
jgi:hypothetical protein